MSFLFSIFCFLTKLPLNQVIAKNEFGTSTSVGTLHVLAQPSNAELEEAPVIVAPIRDVYVDEGSELKLSAKFVGNPIPEVYWKKDGEPLTNNERITISCDGSHMNLHITPAEMADNGTYSCFLANPLGEAEQTCNANVKKVFQRPYFNQK